MKDEPRDSMMRKLAPRCLAQITHSDKGCHPTPRRAKAQPFDGDKAAGTCVARFSYSLRL